MLLIGYPGKENTDQYLVHVPSEIKAIKNLITSAAIIENDDATVENVITKAKEYDLLHFACHGFMNWSRPEELGLVLSEWGWLTIQKITNDLDLMSTSTIIIAACEAGLDHIRSDEHQSIVRAFLKCWLSISYCQFMAC